MAGGFCEKPPEMKLNLIRREEITRSQHVLPENKPIKEGGDDLKCQWETSDNYYLLLRVAIMVWYLEETGYR